MKNNIINQSEKIIKVALSFNFIILMIFLFYTSKSFFLLSTLINITLLGSFLVLEKYKDFFGAMLGSGKSANILNNALGKLNG